MKPKILVYDTKPYDREFFDKYNARYEYEIKYIESRLNEDNAILSKGYNVVCLFVNDYVDKKIANILYENGVRLIALRCAGYNNIDLDAVKNKITVVRVPAYSPHAVAEHTVALLLTLNRKIHKAYNRVRELNFSLNGLMGFDLYQKTVGIIGTGKIGKITAEILGNGFGMKVLAYDIYPDLEWAKKNNFNYVELEQLFKNSDVISLHTPLTQETFHIINEKNITLMKDGVYIINTSRGKLIDTKALIDGLKTGKIGGAALDVYEEESEYFFEDFSNSYISDDTLARLLTFPNVLITSHQAFFTKEALNNIAQTTFENIKNFFEKNKICNAICVNCG